MRVTRTEKNQNPMLFGYGSLEQLQSDPESKQTHWVPFKDADGDLRFIPCTEEYFHWHRNEERNERRRKDTESRCLIHSEKFGLVKCRSDCSQCSKVRDGFSISMDYIRENYDFEFADDSFEAEQVERQEQEQRDFIWNAVAEFDPADQEILKLFNEGKTDAVIAEVVKKSRSMVQERRAKLVKLLNEKLGKYGE